MDTLLYTPDELATELRIPRATIDRWRYNHQGPTAIRVGRHVRYRSSDVRAWIDSRPVREAYPVDRVRNRLERPVPSASVSVNGPHTPSGEEPDVPSSGYVCHACSVTLTAPDDVHARAQGWLCRSGVWYCTACSYTQ